MNLKELQTLVSTACMRESTADTLRTIASAIDRGEISVQRADIEWILTTKKSGLIVTLTAVTVGEAS